VALADELQRAKAREEIAKLDAGERRLASELKLYIPARSLSADIRDRFSLFEAWCGDKSVRRLPAKPWTVAAFILDQTAAGRDAQGCLALLAAIAEVHDVHSLSNPTATAAVRTALEQIIKTEPPRSWSRDQKATWATLPPDVRQIITEREGGRDRALKTKFNELADLRRRLMTDADKLGQTNEVKEIENVTTP
jgi:hypothetical protein